MNEKTDITFKTDRGIFNYRVAALIISSGKILIMKDDEVSHYYLPGGRVKMQERAEDAILRELKEELKIDANVIRPLWLDQNFFGTESSRFHELCIYFLTDVAHSNICREQRFTVQENSTLHIFEWKSFNELKNENFYPTFLKEKIEVLPEHFMLVTEKE